MSALDQLKAAKRAAACQRHQSSFRRLWRAFVPGLPLHEEFPVPGTECRFDFAHPGALVGIELHGGIWMRYGAHNTGKAIMRDCRKAREAHFAGWVVFPFTPEQITREEILRLAGFIQTRALHLLDPYKQAK